MDIWIVKLKDKTKWNLGSSCEHRIKFDSSPAQGYCNDTCSLKCIWWMLTEENINDSLDEDNFYINGFEDADKVTTLLEFADNILGKQFKLNGDPIVDPDLFEVIVTDYEAWLRHFRGGNLSIEADYYYEGIDGCKIKAYIDYTAKEIQDLAVYLRTALDHDFLLWLSC